MGNENHNNIALFPKSVPRWVSLINVFIPLLYLMVVAISCTVFIFLAYPMSNWWNLLDYSVRPEHRLLYFGFACDILNNLFVATLVVFLGMTVFGLIRAIRGKLDWNAFLIWVYIHIGFTVLAFAACSATHFIMP